MVNNVRIPIEKIIQALMDTDKPLLPKYLYRLSDLEPDEVNHLQGIWHQIPTWRRQAIIEDIEQFGENDTLLSFEALSRMALKDEDACVRELAVLSLWDYDSPDLINTFLEMLENDVAYQVRAAAASALGKYVYLGETEKIPETTLHMVEDKLIKTNQSAAEPLVRLRILEALGFSSREEVTPMIESAYYSGEKDWLESALVAMGRSANDYWISHVNDMLDSDVINVRLEAARAAGELEAKSCLNRLIELLSDEEQDVRMAAVWSLSQIGGEGVRDALEKLYDETTSDYEADLIEDALENLSFTDDMPWMTMLDLSDFSDDSEDWDEQPLPQDND